MTDEINEIMTEAHELISRSLGTRGLEAVHLVCAVTPDGTGILRTNAGPQVVRELAETLREIGSHVQAKTPGETTH